MRRILEKLFKWLEHYLYDDDTHWYLECEIYRLKREVAELQDALEYHRDVLHKFQRGF